MKKDSANTGGAEPSTSACVPPVKWIRTYYAADEGKLYREFEIPRMDGLHLDGSKRVEGDERDSTDLVWEHDLEPAMFR